MDDIDRELMKLEFMLAQHRATPHKELPTLMPDDKHAERWPRLSITLPPDVLRLLDDYRRKQPFMPNRSETIADALRAQYAGKGKSHEQYSQGNRGNRSPLRRD